MWFLELWIQVVVNGKGPVEWEVLIIQLFGRKLLLEKQRERPATICEKHRVCLHSRSADIFLSDFPTHRLKSPKIKILVSSDCRWSVGLRNWGCAQGADKLLLLRRKSCCDQYCSGQLSTQMMYMICQGCCCNLGDSIYQCYPHALFEVILRDGIGKIIECGY